MSDIKVGDVVSVCIDGDWLAMRIKTKFDIPAIAANTPKLGLHESLIPEGFAIVPIEQERELVKSIEWRVNDIREMLLQNGSCDEWSTAIINLNSLLAILPTDK